MRRFDGRSKTVCNRAPKRPGGTTRDRPQRAVLSALAAQLPYRSTKPIVLASIIQVTSDISCRKIVAPRTAQHPLGKKWPSWTLRDDVGHGVDSDDLAGPVRAGRCRPRRATGRQRPTPAPRRLRARAAQLTSSVSHRPAFALVCAPLPPRRGADSGAARSNRYRGPHRFPPSRGAVGPFRGAGAHLVVRLAPRCGDGRPGLRAVFRCSFSPAASSSASATGSCGRAALTWLGEDHRRRDDHGRDDHGFWVRLHHRSGLFRVHRPVLRPCGALCRRRRALDHRYGDTDLHPPRGSEPARAGQRHLKRPGGRKRPRRSSEPP